MAIRKYNYCIAVDTDPNSSHAGSTIGFVMPVGAKRALYIALHVFHGHLMTAGSGIKPAEIGFKNLMWQVREFGMKKYLSGDRNVLICREKVNVGAFADELRGILERLKIDPKVGADEIGIRILSHLAHV